MLLAKLFDSNSKQKILILGLGLENLQFLDWLTKVIGFDPSRIILADKKERHSLPKEIIENYDLSQSSFGKNYLNSLIREDLLVVIKSPGIWSLRPEFINFRQKFGEDRIISSLAFFIERFKSHIIGVTGTKGKSTTASLTHHLLNDFGFRSDYCGNTTGISPYIFWKKREQNFQSDRVFIIELSSFQLQDLGFSKLSPQIALISNYLVDHLDQHANEQEYWSAKDNIFLYQDLGTDKVITITQVANISTKITTHKPLVINNNLFELAKQKIKTNLLGDHNYKNLCLALAGVLVKCDYSDLNLENINLELEKFITTNDRKLSNSLSNYQALPHRLELIKEIIQNESLIRVYDDGFATDSDAVIAAIKALTKNTNEKLCLIITGVDKGDSKGNLARLIDSKIDSGQVLKVILCSQVGRRVKNHLSIKNQTKVNFYGTLRLAFQKEIKPLIKVKKVGSSNENQIKENLNIVLSPGGSSFDEFNNATDRSNWWQENIKKLE